MIELLDDPAPAPEKAGIVDPSIIAQAIADDAPAPDPAAPVAAPGAAAPPIDYAREASDLIEFCHTLYVPLFPSLGDVYTPEVRQRIAAAAVPVMQKYGFSLGDFFGKWAPEIGLAVTVAPLIPPTLAAIRRDRAVRENAAPNNKQAGQHDEQKTPPPPAAANDLLGKLAASEQQNQQRTD